MGAPHRRAIGRTRPKPLRIASSTGRACSTWPLRIRRPTILSLADLIDGRPQARIHGDPQPDHVAWSHHRVQLPSRLGGRPARILRSPIGVRIGDGAIMRLRPLLEAGGIGVSVPLGSRRTSPSGPQPTQQFTQLHRDPVWPGPCPGGHGQRWAAPPALERASRVRAASVGRSVSMLLGLAGDPDTAAEPAAQPGHACARPDPPQRTCTASRRPRPAASGQAPVGLARPGCAGVARTPRRPA